MRKLQEIQKKINLGYLNAEAFEVMDDPTKVEEITKKWEKKLKKCTDLSETNVDFQVEIEECLKTKMSEE